MLFRFCGAVWASSDGPVVVCLGIGVSFGVIRREEGTAFEDVSAVGEVSSLDSILPSEVGGVEDETREVEATELPTDVGTELGADGAEPTRPVADSAAKPFALFGLVI